MTGYSITVTAANATDAADIAKRRAREDGYAVRTLKRVVHVHPPVDGKPGVYSVELAVMRQ